MRTCTPAIGIRFEVLTLGEALGVTLNKALGEALGVTLGEALGGKGGSPHMHRVAGQFGGTCRQLIIHHVSVTVGESAWQVRVTLDETTESDSI